MIEIIGFLDVSFVVSNFVQWNAKVEFAVIYIQVANEVIEELNLRPEEVYLGQGTLRPDLIESASELASGKADAIKTHHNDTDLVRELRKQVCEPLHKNQGC
jgi:GMP synthase PP-ATPase subunit